MLISKLNISISPINVDNSVLVLIKDNILILNNNIKILNNGALKVLVPIRIVEILIPILVPSLYKEFKLLSGYSKKVIISLTIF
jgi:hypothetical protein